jgi:hypothetical protein
MDTNLNGGGAPDAGRRPSPRAECRGAPGCRPYACLGWVSTEGSYIWLIEMGCESPSKLDVVWAPATSTLIEMSCSGVVGGSLLLPNSRSHNMRVPSMLTAALVAASLTACGGTPSSVTPGLGSLANIAQPSHRVKPDVTSVTAAIQNTYSSAITLMSSSGCLSASPPSPVAANSTSSSFAIAYNPTCAGGVQTLGMKYGPALGSLGDNCTFNVSYTVSSGTFSYSVANESRTSCSYRTSGVTPLDVLFIYAHN